MTERDLVVKRVSADHILRLRQNSPTGNVHHPWVRKREPTAASKERAPMQPTIPALRNRKIA